MKPDTFSALTDEWMNGLISADSHAALAKHLLDPDAARDFVRLTRTDGELSGYFTTQPDAERRPVPRRRPSRLAWSLGTAAAIVIGGTAIAWQRVRQINAGPSVNFSKTTAVGSVPENAETMEAGAEPAQAPTSPESTAPSPVPDAPPEPVRKSPFVWDIVQLGGRDYISAGSVNEFYRFNELVRTDGTLTFQSPRMMMLWTADSRRIFINDCRFNAAYPVLESDGNLLVSRADLAWMIEPVLRPGRLNMLPLTTVVIDAGHGGNDPGTTGRLGQEKAYTLDMARRLKRHLTDAGLNAVMTREDDRFLKISERAGIANATASENPRLTVFVSIHFHGGPAAGKSDAASRGIETFVHNRAQPVTDPTGPEPERDVSEPGAGAHGIAAADDPAGDKKIASSIALATGVHAKLNQVLRGAGSREMDRGISGSDLGMLRSVNMPAILVTPGSLTYIPEATSIDDPAWRERCAEAISDGIQNFRKATAAEGGE